MVSLNTLEHNTHHFVQISPRYSTSRTFRQAVKPCSIFKTLLSIGNEKTVGGICLSILIQKPLIVYDTVQILLSQVLQCSIFHLIKQKQTLQTMKEKKSKLKQMVYLQPKQLRKYLRSCDSDVILVLFECRHNVLLGHVRLKVRDLEKYRHIFESVLKKKSSMDELRALLLTKTGFELVQLIINFCFI